MPINDRINHDMRLPERMIGLRPKQPANKYRGHDQSAVPSHHMRPKVRLGRTQINRPVHGEAQVSIMAQLRPKRQPMRPSARRACEQRTPLRKPTDKHGCERVSRTDTVDNLRRTGGHMRDDAVLVNPRTFLSGRENPALDGELADQSVEEIRRTTSGAEQPGYDP